MNCFAHSHMTMRQYGLYTRIRELQNKFGFVYFDGDDLAAGFQSTSRDSVFRDCKALIGLGFFEEIGARNRKKDGTWEARKIQAITHKQWAEKHPSSCTSAIGPVAPVLLVQSPNATDQSPNATDQSPNATDQSLPCNKDLVPIRHCSKPDKVQGRADGCERVVFEESRENLEAVNPIRQIAPPQVAKGVPQILPSINLYESGSTVPANGFDESRLPVCRNCQMDKVDYATIAGKVYLQEFCCESCDDAWTDRKNLSAAGYEDGSSVLESVFDEKMLPRCMNCRKDKVGFDNVDGVVKLREFCSEACATECAVAYEAYAEAEQGE